MNIEERLFPEASSFLYPEHSHPSFLLGWPRQGENKVKVATPDF